MTLVLYLLARALLGSPEKTSSSFNRNMNRNRLRKKSRGRNMRRSIYSCNGIFDVIRAQSCLTILSNADDDDLPGIDRGEGRALENAKPHVGFLLSDKKAIPSEDSLLSDYSEASMEDSIIEMHRTRSKTPILSITQLSNPSLDELKAQHHRRTRPKTPVFAIGQLERSSTIRHHDIDKAQFLADQYRDILPPRAITPCVEQLPQRLTPKRLRKIKCQVSLRDLVKDQARRSLSSPRSTYSDAETLVGTDSPPASPLSKKFKEFDCDEVLPLARSKKSHQSDGENKRDDGRTLSSASAQLSTPEEDIGLKITIDLLTNELATALYKHHPAEITDRASGLQVLLMIEAYESMQQHVRRRIWEKEKLGGKEEKGRLVDGILEGWLRVLYEVYDRTQEKEEIENVEEEEEVDEFVDCVEG